MDIIIIKKGILEDLIKNEGWKFINIFPNGRKIKGLGRIISAAFYTVLTVFRLHRILKQKKYDLLITDDLLTINGRIKGIPSILSTDDDLSAVPESFILMSSAKYILAPAVSGMGKYEKKKIGYYGYKALAHLHPNRFIPDMSKLNPQLKGKVYFLIRLVSVTSTHDLGNKGINNGLLSKIISVLEPEGEVIINSERELPSEFLKYCLVIDNTDIAHYLAFARIFISDSTTMCAEAAVLGTSAIEINDWFDDFRQYQDLHLRYGLVTGIRPSDEDKIITCIEEILNEKNYIDLNNQKQASLLHDSIDVSAFIYWLLSEFPESAKIYFNNKDVQLRFK